MDCAFRSDLGVVAGAGSSAAAKEIDVNTSCPDGRRWEHVNRGNSGAQHLDSPDTGTKLDQNFVSRQFNTCRQTGTDSGNSASVHRLDLPQFDGSNPKLWQRRCEEQFRRGLTPANQWTSLSSD
jgi:hypothetical protein